MTDPKLFKFRSLDDPIKLNYDLDCAKGLLSKNSYTTPDQNSECFGVLAGFWILANTGRAGLPFGSVAHQWLWLCPWHATLW